MSDHETTTRPRDDNETTLERSGFLFVYYPRVGGLVISRGPTVIDAGVIGTPGPITWTRLAVIARQWVAWRHDYYIQRAAMRTFTGNRPTDGG